MSRNLDLQVGDAIGPSFDPMTVKKRIVKNGTVYYVLCQDVLELYCVINSEGKYLFGGVWSEEVCENYINDL